MSGDLRDSISSDAAVSRSDVVFDGVKWDVVADLVDLGDGSPRRREYVRHPGAVLVVAIDDDGRLLLINQYRHPVRMRLWELPAGLLDSPGEDPAAAAARELAEETDLVAERYEVLVDYLSSPGGSDEAQRVYLARGLSPVPPAQRHQRSEEEAGITLSWVDLDEAVAAVLAGDIHNSGAVVGILAAAASRSRGWGSVREAGSPWPEHPDHRPTPREDLRATQP